MQDEAAELRLLPPPSGTVVRRERLLRLLDAAARRRVTLVVGPAGYGKTTLLSQWVAWNRSRHVAWLGLHPNDDDPVRLQRRFRAAMEPIVGTVGAVGAVGTGEGDFDGQHRPGELPLVLVLDDVEAISNRTLCQRLAADLDAMPLLRFILVSRADPFAPGSRFQLGHPIVELRRRDLAFDRWEAQELLTRLSRKPLSAAHSDPLLARTAGRA